MKVMFDVDGVLADFVQGYTAVANHLFGTRRWTTHEQQTWEFTESGITKEQDEAIWRDIKRGGFWLMLEPLASRAEFEAINALQQDYHEVYFVTSRPGATAQLETEVWLARYGIDRPTVIVTSRKGEIAAALEADFSLEDKAGNAVYIAYHSPRTRSHLIDRPYNQFDSTVIGSRVVRVKSVSEFLDHIRRHVPDRTAA